MIPAAVTVVNFTWLREHPRWEFLRTTHLQMAVDWWNSASGMHVPVPQRENVMPVPNPVLQTLPPPARRGVARGEARCQDLRRRSLLPFLCRLVVPPEQSTPSWILTFKLLERLAKGYTWVGSVLLLVGLACGWRIFLRPEHLTLFCMNLLLLVDLADSLLDCRP